VRPLAAHLEHRIKASTVYFWFMVGRKLNENSIKRFKPRFKLFIDGKRSTRNSNNVQEVRIISDISNALPSATVYQLIICGLVVRVWTEDRCE
jgi:hypothetical protein